MKKKTIWLILSFVMALSLVLASCTTTVEEEEEEGPPPTEEEEEEGPPVSGDWWDKFGEPEYGGTLSLGASGVSGFFDPYLFYFGSMSFYMEQLFYWDWTIDREVWPFLTAFVPAEYYAGGLAESWEWKDEQTLTVHLRQGVLWHDRPPTNGREFTADDVEKHYDRMLGLDEYADAGAAPRWRGRWGLLERVVATDKYTVDVIFSAPSVSNYYTIVEQSGQNIIEAPDGLAIGAVRSEPDDAVGTGPWMLTEYIDGSVATYSKNPSYYGYDERHPENQLPYADKFKEVAIPDIATRMAALRTGKVDMLEDLTWEQAASLARTNPEIEQAKRPMPGPGIFWRFDRKPFDDIKVRKALQMAIDRKTIAETHYGGLIDGIPCGWVNPAHKGYYYPYEEWPQELKDEYGYNPERARQLLAEAGYPDGFETDVNMSSAYDVDLAQIIKAYFADIGVELEIRVQDPTTYQAEGTAKSYNQMHWTALLTGSTHGPEYAVGMSQSMNASNYSILNDATYDAMYAEWQQTTDPEKARQLIYDMDKYNIEIHQAFRTMPIAVFNVWQPYLKGYMGEQMDRIGSPGGWPWARWWVDQDLKKSMGR